MGPPIGKPIRRKYTLIPEEEQGGKPEVIPEKQEPVKVPEKVGAPA